MQDPSMQQSASGLNTTRGIDSSLNINKKEKQILRELAIKMAEIAANPREKEKANAWRDLNMLQPKRPLVFCDPENGWNEIITREQIKCGSPLARVWEMYLRKEIFWAEKMKDDKVIEPFLNIPYHYTDSGYGIQEEDKVKGEGDGSFKYLSHLRDYKKDFEKLSFPEISIDNEKTNQVKELAEDIVGDILNVRIKGVWWWTLGMTWDFIKIRGLENLMTDVLIQPEWVHRLMRFLRDATLEKLAFLEKNNLLSLNNDGTYVGSGGFGWTDELPMAGYEPGKVRLMDLWGFAESQETVGMDPSLFNEFILPYQIPILEKFGLNCYGCCEPLDTRWQHVKTIPRLRRVSVSPWADVQTMSGYLGKEYIFSRKPSPTDLAVPNPDWDKVRRELREFFKSTRNNNVEIIMKDNHTLGKNPDNAITWCKIAREESQI